MKKVLLLFGVICFLLCVNMPPINADSVVYENSYGRLSVYPRVSFNVCDHVQHWEFDSDVTAVVDIAFVFNDSLRKGGLYILNGERYNPLSYEHINVFDKHAYVFSGLSVVNGDHYEGKIEYTMPVGTSGKWDMYVKLESDSWSNYRIHLDPWYDSNYTNMVNLYVDHTQVSENLANFTVCVKIEQNESLYDVVNTNLSDIIFVKENDTLMDFELEYENVGGGTVDAVYWVRMPYIWADNDTCFQMYWNNSHSSDLQDVEHTWDDTRYTAIWHMNNLTDSIGDFPLTNNGADALQWGMAGLCYEWVDANDDTMYNETLWDDGFPTGWGYEAWFYPNSASITETIIAKSNVVSQDVGYVGIHSVAGDCYGVIEASNDGYDAVNSGNAVDVESWNYVALTHTQNTKGKLYQDGDKEKYQANNHGNPGAGSARDFTIGSNIQTGANGDFDGFIDEVRISKIQFNTSWIQASYRSVENSSQEAIDPFIIWGDWEYYGSPANESNETGITPNNLFDFEMDIGEYTYIMLILWLYFITIGEWKRDTFYLMIAGFIGLAFSMHLLFIPEVHVFYFFGCISVCAYLFFVGMNLYRSNRYG